MPTGRAQTHKSAHFREPLPADLDVVVGHHQEATEQDTTRGTYPVPGFPVEARLDWLAAKGIYAKDPVVIPAAMSPQRKRPVSDHHAIAATFWVR